MLKLLKQVNMNKSDRKFKVIQGFGYFLSDKREVEILESVLQFRLSKTVDSENLFPETFQSICPTTPKTLGGDQTECVS